MITIRVTTSWWTLLEAETLDPSFLDELGPLRQHLEQLVAASTTARRTKAHLDLTIDRHLLEGTIDLAHHLARYWGQTRRNQCDDFSQRGVWALRGRSSSTLALQLAAQLECTPTSTPAHDNASRWSCPKCGQAVVCHIPPVEPPVCGRHIRGGAQMVRA